MLKIAGGPTSNASLPGKLRNPWTGPYKFVRWSGDRRCFIISNGKEMEYDVNRLFKHHGWNEHHLDTSGNVVGSAPIDKVSSKRTKSSFPAIVSTPSGG